MTAANAPDCSLTAADLVTLTDPYIVILATLGQPELRRPAAILCQRRGLWLSARPSRHVAILDEALSAHVHMHEAA